MANFCPQCGNEIASNASFCAACGASASNAAYDNAASSNPYDAGAPIADDATRYVDGDAPTIPGFGEAIKICLSKWLTWQGRASRSEYWWFTLFSILTNVVCQALVNAASNEAFLIVCGFAAIIWSVWCGLAGLAVTIRRLHDTNRSGWNMWWLLLPYVGGIVLLIFELQASTPGPNRFGPQPVKR